MVSISAYNGEGGKITLPTTAEINGKEYQITSVGNAFEGNESITGVTIPDGYTEIGLSAFKDCTGLQSVEIPGSVDMISTNAFSGCTALNTVNFDDDTAASLTINLGAFANCTALTSIGASGKTQLDKIQFSVWLRCIDINHNERRCAKVCHC